MQIKVVINLFGILKQYSKENPLTVSIEKGTPVTDVLKTLNIPEGLVMYFTVDGAPAEKNHIINKESNISAFPPVGGG